MLTPISAVLIHFCIVIADFCIGYSQFLSADAHFCIHAPELLDISAELLRIPYAFIVPLFLFLFTVLSFCLSIFLKLE